MFVNKKRALQQTLKEGGIQTRVDNYALYMCVTYCRCLLVKGPHQTVTTRLKKHSHTLMFPQHLRVFMGTLSKLALTNTHTHKCVCIRTLIQDQANLMRQPDQKADKHTRGQRRLRANTDDICLSIANKMLSSGVTVISTYLKRQICCQSIPYLIFLNCLFCCFSVKRIMCKITSQLVTAFLFALFHRNCKVALWCWIMPNHSLFLTSRVYVVL